MTDAIASRKELPHWRRAAYGFGDFGFNLYWTTVSFYILYFYTDVLGLSGKVAGLIFLAAMLWDAITDPVIGYIAQRTRSRWGSYRPYILFGAAPLAVSLVLVFLDTEFEGAMLILYALAAHLAFRTAYTLVNIPYSALSARLTECTVVRNSLSAWRICLATMGSALVAYSTLKLVAHFGQGDAKFGFMATAALFAGLSLPVFATLFLTTEEPYLARKRTQEPRSSADRPPSFGPALRGIVRNRPLLTIMGATIFATVGGVLLSKTLVYYFKYTLGDETAVGLAFATNSLVILCAVPAWAALTRRTSKRLVWQAGALVSITGCVGLFVNPHETVPVVVAIAAVSAIGSAAGYLTYWSALPDTVEFGEFRNRRRDEAFVFGIMSFVQKSAYGIGAAVAGLLMDAIGYKANALQSPETLAHLKLTMTILPASCLAIAFVIIGTYSLDAKSHKRIVNVLRYRRHH